jgi:hypothetical protein
MGEWEGLAFSQIRETWPELYEERGRNPEVSPPHGETLSGATERIADAFQQILSKSSGNIIITAHSAVNRLLICKLRGLSLSSWAELPQPYGCINTILINGYDITVGEIGILPRDFPAEEECFRLMAHKETPQAVIDHCRAVAAKADELADALIRQGFHLDRGIIHAGALMHDIARAFPNHPKLGASWIAAAGYPRIAKVVAEHEFLPEPIIIDESAIVYLADKLIQGTEEVSLEMRFANSLKKCHDEEARQNHEMRACQAFSLWNKIFPLQVPVA